MKGMILKDLYTMRSYLRTMGFMFVFYLVLGMTTGNTGFFAGFVGVLCIIMSISSFSYDQAAQWDVYGASLPISRRQMVGAKYLLALLLAFVGMVVSAISYLLFALVTHNGGLNDTLSSALGAGCSGILMVGLIFPVIYRFGVEKSRLVMLIFGACVMAVIFFSAQAGTQGIRITDTQIQYALWASPVLLIAGLVFSYRLSCRFFEQKEL